MLLRFFLLLSVLCATYSLPSSLISAGSRIGAASNDVTASFEHFSRRGLRQTESSSSCRWDPTVALCVTSDADLADALRDSENPFSRLLLRFSECGVEGEDPTSCVAHDDCGWNRQSERCEYVDFSDEYALSPCVAPVYKTFHYNALLQKCPYLDSTECSRLPGCVWEEQPEVCHHDLYRVYFNLDNQEFSTSAETVEAAKSTLLWETFQSEFDFEPLSEEWDATLEWEVPETDCPEGVDELVCEYADIFLPRVLPTFFYCRSKYSTPFNSSECRTDDLCEYNTFQGQCLGAYWVSRQAWTEADKLLLEFVSEPADRRIAQNTLSCRRARGENECTGRNCVWNRDTNVCEIDARFVADQILSQSETDPSDPVCMYYSNTVEYDCMDKTTAKACHQTENCEWNLVGKECVTGRQVNLNTIREEDEDVAVELFSHEIACGTRPTRRRCV